MREGMKSMMKVFDWTNNGTSERFFPRSDSISCLGGMNAF